MGDSHTVLLRSDGSAVAIGNNHFGQWMLHCPKWLFPMATALPSLRRSTVWLSPAETIAQIKDEMMLGFCLESWVSCAAMHCEQSITAPQNGMVYTCIHV